MWEIIIVVVVALIILGPRQLTETAKTLGRLYRDIQKLTWELKNSIDLDSALSTDTTDRSSRDETQPSAPGQGESPVKQQDELPPVPGERSGPDFYAQLLESSEESGQLESSPTDETLRETSGSEEEEHTTEKPEQKEGTQS